MMRTLFLQAPSFDGFDGGAGSRYQAKREIQSFWYPTWLAQPAALVEGSQADRRAAAPASASTTCCRRRSDYDLVRAAHLDAVLRVRREGGRGAEGGQPGPQDRPDRRQGRGRSREASLARRAAIDFVARNEFDFTVKEVAEGRDLGRHRRACPTATPTACIVHNDGAADPRGHGRAALRTPVYKRDLDDRELLHRLSAAPVRVVLHRARLQIALHLLPVAADGRRAPLPHAQRRPRDRRDPLCAQEAFPQVKEFFFDDDTFTDDLPRAEAIARELGKLGVTWSCNAKANVPRETLEGAEGQRPAAAAGRLRVRQPADPAQHQEGHADRRGASSFTRDCHELGITIHGTFILGLPGETKETIEETIRFATEINPHTIQVSLAAPYPGTFLYKQARRERLARHRQCRAGRRQRHPDRAAALPASDATPRSSTRSRTFYRRFYFRAPKIAAIVGEMVREPGDDEAPPARGRRVLPASCARAAARPPALKRLRRHAPTISASRPRSTRPSRRRTATAS